MQHSLSSLGKEPQKNEVTKKLEEAVLSWHTEQIFHSKILRQYLDMIPPVEDMLYRIGLSETEYKILDGGVSGALFDADFSDRLTAMLTEQDRKKIEINKMYM